jgi:CBS domain containing-hemolysin-like protein
MNVDPVIILLKILALVVLVLLNGFFVAAEFALVKIRDTQLVTLASGGNRRARMARRLIGNLDASLSATQLGITLASLGLGWVGEPVFLTLLEPVMQWLQIESARLQHTLAFLVGFSVITFLHIVVGELAPKSLAIQKPLPTSLWISYPLHWFNRIFYPLNWSLNGTSRWLLRRLGLEAVSEAELVHSEEELRLLFSTTRKHSGGSALGRDIVLNALDLRRRVVREVMRPRQEIVALNTEASIAECLEIAEHTRFSRFPLCDGGDLDKTLGVIHLKDLFSMRLKVRSGAQLVPAARKIVYVPETAHLEKLLRVLLDRKLHLAIVIDEFGGTTGLITLENILEELVGQIQDEFDQEKPRAIRIGEQTWDVLGTLPLHDLEKLVGEPLPDEGITTASGWVTHRLGGFPKVGDVVALGGCELRVEEMEDTRVARLRLRRLASAESAAVRGVKPSI